DLLYQRINQRAVEQFESGLIEETKALLDKYQIANSKNQKPSLHPNVATSFGYLEIEQYLQGLMTYEECLTKNQQRNRNYAKRQLTWWRGREDIVWIDGNTTT
ncbi:MAG TPA: tRNA dimethylallyltransferase, partial [Candidatus Gracilibacteria bacterium]